FDEIVAFAEIEQFLDTPVKRYSSGMYVRLAFAVAAHLQPEILLIDEVLAVGDQVFQKKCLGKMNDIGHSVRPVLFVSHDMGGIDYLCPQSVLIQDGKVLKFGKTSDVVNTYLRSTTTGAESLPGGLIPLDHHSGRRPGSLQVLQAFRMLDG